jgi:hypothetical protein
MIYALCLSHGCTAISRIVSSSLVQKARGTDPVCSCRLRNNRTCKAVPLGWWEPRGTDTLAAVLRCVNNDSHFAASNFEPCSSSDADVANPHGDTTPCLLLSRVRRIDITTSQIEKRRKVLPSGIPNLVQIYRRFGGIYCVHSRDREISRAATKYYVASTVVLSINIYQTTQRHIIVIAVGNSNPTRISNVILPNLHAYRVTERYYPLNKTPWLVVRKRTIPTDHLSLRKNSSL